MQRMSLGCHRARTTSKEKVYRTPNGETAGSALPVLDALSPPLSLLAVLGQEEAAAAGAGRGKRQRAAL